jgi:hypothetical protein
MTLCLSTGFALMHNHKVSVSNLASAECVAGLIQDFRFDDSARRDQGKASYLW